MKIVQKIISSILAETYGIHIPEAKINLENPPKSEFGDYAFSCFTLARETRKSPNILAEEVKTSLQSQEWIQNVSTIGGYVNFFVDKKLLLEDLWNLSLEPKEKKNETIIVDYVATNLGKIFHMAHMCSAMLGQSILNIHKYLGYTALWDSHWWDWGSLFGKLITAIKLFWDAKKLDEIGADYIWELYVKISNVCSEDSSIEDRTRQEFILLSRWDPENTSIWEAIIKCSKWEMKKALDKMHIYPDFGNGESFYEGLSLPYDSWVPPLKYSMNDIVEELLKKGILEQNDDGSVGINFPENTKIPSTVVRKRDGANMYLTSELATIKYRQENWKPTKSIYCVDMRQALHFKQAFWMAKKAWPETENTEFNHCSYGTVYLNGKPMASRTGNVIKLRDLFTEAHSRTASILKTKWQELSSEDIEKIGVWAIKYSYLGQDREKDITFDWDKALAFDGNSGPYIQYTFVRAKNIITKALESSIQTQIDQRAADNLTSYDIDLMKTLFRFDEAVLDAATKYKPHILAQYCFSLANTFNSFYAHTPKILEEASESLRSTRLALVEKTSQTLEKWFELLAIKMPSKM